MTSSPPPPAPPPKKMKQGNRRRVHRTNVEAGWGRNKRPQSPKLQRLKAFAANLLQVLELLPFFKENEQQASWRLE